MSVLKFFDVLYSKKESNVETYNNEELELVYKLSIKNDKK